MSFEGYTGGGSKEAIDGLLCSGDVGHIDADGRLFIDGRDDEMIVSGGENVFPREVEDLLADHEAVVEVAVIGVEDAEFGQRLKAFVVVETAPRSARTTSRRTSRPTSPATRRRARSSSSTSCRATPPARSSSATCTRARLSSPPEARLRLQNGLAQIAGNRDGDPVRLPPVPIVGCRR